MEQSRIDLEAELDLMIAEETGDTVVSTILEQASELTLADLKKLGVVMPTAGTVTLAQLFEEYKSTKRLVK